jgi:hypothetical protein
MDKSPPSKSVFERGILEPLCMQLNAELGAGTLYNSSAIFERKIREVLDELVAPFSLAVDFNPHPHIFPDIVLGIYGIEVKFTVSDTWRSIANSVFESTRDLGVEHIYVLFGKMGGDPEVAWGEYEEAVIHVRTSHVPRFEVEMSTEQRPRQRDSLFTQFGISYNEFATLEMSQKMQYIRAYARGHIGKGEHLWWIEDQPDSGHSLPLQVRLYMNLAQAEKRQLRAEAALLCPEIVKPSRVRGKYEAATMYLLTYHGVLCPQTRDLFSAGSVAGPARGGNYVLRALVDIQEEMRVAAATLDDALFVEYWGSEVPREERINRWLERADQLAVEWRPSEHLFLSST